MTPMTRMKSGAVAPSPFHRCEPWFSPGLRAWLIVAVVGCSSTLCGDEPKPFQIRVVDDETGRGVPLVELRTVHEHLYVTDSAGRVAVREPELLGQAVYFHVRSHGYDFPRDGFGFRGRALKVEPGGAETIKIKRLNIAERLYRVTGAGIYADSVTLGESAPIKQPLLNAQVTGSDSVVTAVYRDRLHWFWGDTNRLRYPLGNYQVTGATSRLPGDGGLDPAVGVDFDYFTGDDGFAKQMAKMPGDGPTWMFGIVVVKGSDGRERMFTGYEKIRGTLEIYERGIAEFDDERREFVTRRQFDKDIPLHLHGHPFSHKVEGVAYFYFGDPFPVMRVRATADDVLDPSRYEGFTCLEPGGRVQKPQVERDASGKPVFGWKKDTAPLTPELQTALLRSGQLKPGEARWNLKDADTDKPVTAHRGSVAWNEHRQRWTMIFTQHFGSSLLGEVWYTEADQPEGPWLRAKKVVTHDKYSFYNPTQHPYFAQEGGRVIYFEGTYTHTFSGNPTPTPRYDYNQMMYRLDLSDPRLAVVREAR
ncbi:MAG: hypothetical protein AABP62_19670 [Planctomycetota bacterium]